jgi:hypothetical protein
MKKIIVILALALLFITAGLLHLAKTGISLRPESLIAPSRLEAGLQDMTSAVMTRLLPQFEESQIIVFQFLPFSPESENFFHQLQQAYETNLHRSATVLDLTKDNGAKDIATCQKPCWVLAPAEATAPTIKADFISLKWVPFSLPVKVPMDCWNEKILDTNCIQLLSIQGNQKKIKPEGRFFFLNGYNEKAYFLFVENPK